MDSQYRQQVSEDVKSKILAEIEPMVKVFDLLQENVVVADKHGNIIYANPITFKRTGFAKEEVLGHNPGDLWGGTMPKEFYQEMWQTLNNKKPWSGKVKNRNKAGEILWGQLEISPVLDDNGDILFFLALTPDITERENLVSDLQDKESVLSSLNKIMVAREVKMSELKEELAKVKGSSLTVGIVNHH